MKFSNITTSALCYAPGIEVLIFKKKEKNKEKIEIEKIDSLGITVSWTAHHTSSFHELIT